MAKATESVIITVNTVADQSELLNEYNDKEKRVTNKISKVLNFFKENYND